ncbi:alanine racemase [Rheinheimera salexigens]|uniref:Alanine racemase n=1 Tax=Rheinheimera salexigens TaxID=1628148 RepID=A0A1E7Q963_9GAMM|nr:alanine racemase [Rheinheimera salexigens]OEY70735.1 alanine racemase [Rheinheimera salexigens]
MHRQPQVQINLQALQHNYLQLKKLAPNSKLLALLKADAYGHGMLEVASALPDVDAFGVARLDEALALRTGGIVKPIVLLEGFFHADELEQVVASNLQIVIHHIDQAEALLAANLSTPVPVWLKLDTGMHRLGILPSDYVDVYERLIASDNVQGPMRLMTHFANSDDLTSDATATQIALFQSITVDLVAEHSLANSAAVLSRPDTHADWVRPGLLLYGVSPLQGHTGRDHNLLPVMSLVSSVIAVRDVAAGDAVGYSGSWTSPKATRVAVVAMGYGDGYPRAAGNKAEVLINNQRFAVVGRVSMDMITVDIGAAAVQVGDEVLFWGPNLPVELLAEKIGTIPYELLCNISSRRRIKFNYANQTE